MRTSRWTAVFAVSLLLMIGACRRPAAPLPAPEHVGPAGSSEGATLVGVAGDALAACGLAAPMQFGVVVRSASSREQVDISPLVRCFTAGPLRTASLALESHASAVEVMAGQPLHTRLAVAVSRARNVEDLLVARGIARDRIRTSIATLPPPLGEAHPDVSIGIARDTKSPPSRTGP